jgi:carotene biosynthesis associated membrane protein
VSVRTYTGPTSSRRPRTLVAVPWVLAAATILLQILYPLVEGDARATLTQITVVTFFLASATHAAVWRGAAWAGAYVVIAVGTGLAVEAIGVDTGYPFGSYDYADSLGPELLGVPIVIPLAWAMMAYPALIAARTLCTGRVTTVVVGAVALASWDVFLDPQMVAEGHWRFTFPDPSPPLLDPIPWTNFAGWFAVALVLMLMLDRLPRRTADDGPPAALYLWTYFSSVLANVAFFDRPGVALAGGLVMGVVAIPYAWTLWVNRP